MKIGISVPEGVVAVARSWTGQAAPGRACRRVLEEGVEAYAATAAAVAWAWEELTRAFVRTTGRAVSPAMLGTPPARLAVRAGEAAATAVPLIWAGTVAVLRAAGVDAAAPAPAPDLLAAWGEALGRALGLPPAAAAALGEFCRTWVHGAAVRRREVEEAVAAAEMAFAAALEAPLPAAPPRPLFPTDPGEIPAYRRAWEAALRRLGEADQGSPDGGGPTA